LPFEEIDLVKDRADNEVTVDGGGGAVAVGRDDDDAAGIDEIDGEMTDEVPIGADEEDRGGAGTEGNAENSDGVNVAATAGPVRDNAMKGAMTDGGKNGIDGP
jgi:hypothetical protein